MRKRTAYSLAFLSLFLGAGSLILFACFIFFGSFGLISLGMKPYSTVFFDIFLGLIFFFQHSIMVRKPFKKILSNIIHENSVDAVYAISSSIALIFVIIVWQDSGIIFFRLDGILRISVRMFFIVAMLGMVWTYAFFRGFDPFGVMRLIFFEKQIKDQPFIIMGPFRHVRHPIYSSIMLMIWANPDMTLDRLVFNISWTLWIILGAFFEEMDLMERFGDLYSEYKRNTPMFLPRFWKD